MIIGSFSKDDGDKNVKEVVGLITKTTTLHVHYTFWYISLPSLHDQDVKFPDGKFCGGCKDTITNFFFLFVNLGAVSKSSTQKISPTFGI